jgi:hypothetical protein
MVATAASGPKSLVKLTVDQPPAKSFGLRAPMNATWSRT